MKSSSKVHALILIISIAIMSCPIIPLPPAEAAALIGPDPGRPAQSLSIPNSSLIKESLPAMPVEQQANMLYNMGLISGTSPVTFTPELNAWVNRETGVVMLIRLFGFEESANALSEEEVNAALSRFVDADQISSWARHAVAYAVINNLVHGTSTNTFGPKDYMTGNSMTTVILTQMGYQTNYPTALEQFQGLSPGLDLPKIPGDVPLQRLEAVVISVGTLVMPGSDGGPTIIEQLVQNNIVDTFDLSGPADIYAILGAPEEVIISINQPDSSPPPPPSPPAPAPPGGGETVVAEATLVPLANDSEYTLNAVCQPEGIVQDLKVERNPAGQWTLSFMPASCGTGTITVNAFKLGFLPQSIKINLTTYGGSLQITGINSDIQVETGLQYWPFSINLADASITVESSDPEVIGDVQCTAYGMDRVLGFNALKPGSAVIAITSRRPGYLLASRAFTVTVVGRVSFQGLDFTRRLIAGYNTIDFTVSPADAVVEIAGYSGVISQPSLTPTAQGYRLGFYSNGEGTGDITLHGSYSGYLEGEKKIDIVTTLENSGPGPL